MIYADPSFLFSLYAWDDNTAAALETYASDGRRPVWLTPWQRFELRNAVRLAMHRFQRAGQPVSFQAGNVLKKIDEDLAGGFLLHGEPDARAAMRLAEELSAEHTPSLGAAAVDLWHVASAIVLKADTFWTFDCDQFRLAAATGKFRHLPRLPRC